MQFKNHIPFSMLLLLSLFGYNSTTGTEQAEANTSSGQNQTMATSNSKIPEQGDIEFRIVERPNFGFHFKDEPKGLPSGLDSSARITTIDGQQTKGLTLTKVKELTRGPIGSQVKFELVSIHGHHLTVILERKATQAAAQAWNGQSLHALRSALDLLDTYDADDLPRDYLHAAHSAGSAGLEPLSTGAFTASVGLSTQWFDKDSTTATVTLMDAAQHYDRVGRFSQADEAISRAVTAISQLKTIGFFYQGIVLHFAKFLQDTERYQDAEAVFKKLVETAETSTSAPQFIYRAYANLLVLQNRTAEAELLQERILKLPKEICTDRDLELAADFYATYGKADKAKALYTELISSNDKNGIEKLSPNAKVYFIRTSYKLASLQEDAKEYDKAIKTLQKVLDYYNEKRSIDQQNDLERLPGDSKTASEIERKLGASLFKKGETDAAVAHQEAAVKRIEKALGLTSGYLRAPLLELASSYQTMGKAAEAEKARARTQALDALPETETEEMIERRNRKVMLSAYKSIQAKDIATSRSATPMLLQAYDDACASTNSESRHRQFINALTYFTSLYIDQNNYEEANKLSEQIRIATNKNGEAQAVVLALLTERAIFAEQLKLNKDECWSELEKALEEARIADPHGSSRTNMPVAPGVDSSVPTTPASGENLRRWAMAYSFNGDYKRAASLLERAYSLCQSGDHLSEDNSSNTSPALLGDLAINHLNLGDSAKTKTYLAKLLSGSQNLGAPTVLKIALLAKTYLNQGQIKESENLLNEAINKVTCSNNSNRSNNSNAHVKVFVPGLYQWKLAELQIQNNRLEQQLLNAALAQYKTAPPTKLLVISADNNYSRGAYLDAARQYVQAQKYYDLMHVQLDPSTADLKQQLLTKALIAADKSKDLPEIEMLEILSKLAESLTANKRQEAAKLYERAMLLLPPESKERATLAMRLAQLSVGNPEKTDEYLSKQQQAAELAEASGNYYAYEIWRQKAITELRAKQTDKALASLGRAIQLYKNLTKHQETFRTLLTNRENTAVAELVKLKLSSQAERLIKEAAEATKAVYGPNSDEAAISLIELANFYAAEGQSDKAIAIAENTLNIYLHNEAQLPLNSTSDIHEAIRRLYDTADLIAEKHQAQKAIDLVTKLLSIQNKNLPPKNAQIGLTLMELGRLYRKAGKLDKAEPLYKKAIEIKQELYGNGRMSRYEIGEYADVLRQLGKNEDADRVSTLPTVHESGTEMSLKLIKLQGDERRLEMRREYEQAQILLEQAYELAKSESPCGSSAMRALEQLAQFHVRQKHYDKAEEAYKKLIEIFALDVSTSNRQRTTTMFALAKLYVMTDKKKDAAEMLRQAKKFDPKIRYERCSVRDLIAYAELELDLGQTQEATKDLEAAETLLAKAPAESPRNRSELQTMAALWRKLGRNDKADIAQSKADELRKKEELERPSPWQRREQMRQAKSPTAIDPIWEKMLGPYMADMERRIFRAWQPARSADGAKIIVRFDVIQNGEVRNLRITGSSGNAEADKKALEAITNAAPFRPLHSGAKPVESFEFNFNNQGRGSDGGVKRL